MGKKGRIEWEKRDGRIRARIGASSKSWKVDEHGADGALRLAQEWLRGQGSAWVTGRRTVDPVDFFVSLGSGPKCCVICLFQHLDGGLHMDFVLLMWMMLHVSVCVIDQSLPLPSSPTIVWNRQDLLNPLCEPQAAGEGQESYVEDRDIVAETPGAPASPVLRDEGNLPGGEDRDVVAATPASPAHREEGHEQCGEGSDRFPEVSVPPTPPILVDEPNVQRQVEQAEPLSPILVDDADANEPSLVDEVNGAFQAANDELHRAILMRADQVSRMREYWGFFDWLLWSHTSATQVILWFGNYSLDLWGTFADQEHAPRMVRVAKKAPPPPRLTYTTTTTTKSHELLPSQVWLKTIHVACARGHRPASGPQFPDINHYILLEPLADVEQRAGGQDIGVGGLVWGC